MASSEQYLISSILRDGDMNVALAQNLTRDMFYAFPDEWEWLERYFLRYKKTPSKLAFKGKFHGFAVKTVNDTAHFASEVRKAHARKLLTGTMSECADLIADGSVEDAVKAMGTSVVRIAAAIGSNNDSDIFSSFEDIYQDVERRVQRVNDTGSSGIPTGFATLDERTGGPQPGDLWILGARLGEGKSYTMQRMATTAVMQGYTVQFDALEQSRAQVAMRIHSMLSSQIGQEVFRSSDLIQGRNFDITLYKKFLRGLRKDLDGRLHVSDTSRGRVGIMTIASQIERNKPDIVFVDYITLMDKKGGEWQDVAALSSGLLGLAQEYEVPIVAASQLNRTAGIGKDMAGPEALSQADAIGQDATAVITMKQTSPKTISMKMAKNRNGSSGWKWHCQFEPDKGVFKEVDYQTMLDLKDSAMDDIDAEHA